MICGEKQIWKYSGISITFAMEIINRRERLPFPSPFYIPEELTNLEGFVVRTAKNLKMEQRIQQIEALIDQLIADEPSYFLVSVRIKPGNDIKIFFDGDEGISIEKCVKFNRGLYKLIEEKAWYPEGDFSLEISSPGIEEPLLLHRQYFRNVGRDLEIVFTDNSIKIGTLMAVTAEDILIQTTEGKGKKAVTQQVLIPFNNIKSTTVQIKF
jgi:ribosome maturation factor RimP